MKSRDLRSDLSIGIASSSAATSATATAFRLLLRLCATALRLPEHGGGAIRYFLGMPSVRCSVEACRWYAQRGTPTETVAGRSRATGGSGCCRAPRMSAEALPM